VLCDEVRAPGVDLTPKICEGCRAGGSPRPPARGRRRAGLQRLALVPGRGLVHGVGLRLRAQAIEDFWTFTRQVGNHPWRLSAIQAG
jgi:hypothetical protein